MDESAELEVTEPARFVSRGGEKLAHALEAFGVDPAGRDALDVGASTGGFTDVLLQRGAARVIALDVGYGQLHPRIRDDPRVTVLERMNVRELRELPFAPRARRLRRLVHQRAQGAAAGARARGARLGGGRARQAAVRGRPRRGAGAASSATARCAGACCARSPTPRPSWEAAGRGRRRLRPARPEGKPRVLPPPRPAASSRRFPMSSKTGSTMRRAEVERVAVVTHGRARDERRGARAAAGARAGARRRAAARRRGSSRSTATASDDGDPRRPTSRSCSAATGRCCARCSASSAPACR